MSKTGRLKGLADVLADQFVSRQHDRGGYWAMGVLYRQCSWGGNNKLEIDLLLAIARPRSRACRRSATEYAAKLRQYVGPFGVSFESLTAARVLVHFDEESRAHRWTTRETGGEPFHVTVAIEDDRGRTGEAVRAGWCWRQSWHTNLRLIVQQSRRSPLGRRAAQALTVMRLDDCAGCGGEFDVSDADCPHCGLPNPAEAATAARLASRRRDSIGCLLQLVVLAGLALLYYKACVEPLP